MKNKYMRLCGFINTFKNPVSFVLPVFCYKESLYLQVIDERLCISSFEALSPELSKSFIEFGPNTYKGIGAPAIYAFKIHDNVYFDSKKALVARLSSIKNKIYDYPFVYYEVVQFIGDKANIYDEIIRISRILSLDNTNIGLKWKNSQLLLHGFRNDGTYNEESDFFSSPEKRNGIFLNYWEILEGLDNLVRNYENVYLKVKLVRSGIGKSRKVKNLLKSFGLKLDRVGEESNFLQCDVYRVKNIKNASNLICLLEVQAFGDQNISIQAVDFNSIRKKYFKKNTNKIVRSRRSKDYRVQVF